MRNLSAHFGSNCIEMLCDNKNKVNVGTLATSRYTKINKFFTTDDQPNYMDHDFPLGYKITPMGYIILEGDLTTHDSKMSYDKTGRLQYNVPQNGKLHIVNRAQKFHSSTIEPHINDLLRILTPEILHQKTILTLIVDNGSDWSPTS